MPNNFVLQQIRDTYPDLDQWQERSELPRPEEPATGSELADDDTLFRWHRISESVRLSLVMSGEHLRMARTSLEAGQVYPSAHFTVLRGALVGAAQAVWILSEDDPIERRERGLALIAEMYKQLRKYYVDVSTTSLSKDQRLGLKDQIMLCDTLTDEISALRTGKADLNQTNIIAKAVEHLYVDKARRDAGKLLWREMSADAHILGWAVFLRGTFAPPEPGSQLSLGTSSDNLEDMADAFLAVHALLKQGWTLFDRRSAV